jgi:hypothetical protein
LSEANAGHLSTLNVITETECLGSSITKLFPALISSRLIETASGAAKLLAADRDSAVTLSITALDESRGPLTLILVISGFT